MIEAKKEKLEKEYKKLEDSFDEKMDGFLHMNYSNKVSPFAFLLFVLQSIFESKDFKLFKREDGEIVTNKKGFPKINWLNVFSSIPKLVYEMSVMFLAYQELKATDVNAFAITEDMKNFEPPQEITDFYAYHKALNSVNRLCDRIKLSKDEIEELSQLSQEEADEFIYERIKDKLDKRFEI